MTVRNGAVAVGMTAPGAQITVYKVPPASAFILKYLNLTNATSGSSTFDAYLARPADGFVLLKHGTLASAEVFEWASWSALSAGDEIQLLTQAALQYWIAGAQLPNLV